MASWKRSLCDGGLHDCLRAYLSPCCVYGQTRYRLDRLDRHENPLDLEGYKTSNGACWDWVFFALPLGISCAVLTSNETRRIRDLYAIEGSHREDIITAIFCPCCSLLRNELEVRTRGEEQWTELHGPDTKGYTPEKPMTSSLPDGVYFGKENKAPGAGSNTSASGSSIRSGNGSRRSSAASRPQSVRDQNSADKTSASQTSTPLHSGRSSPNLSLTSKGNTETVTCTVVDDGHRHVLHLNRSLLTPVIERLSEDTMSTARKSKVCASPPLQGENLPLGSIQESTPAGSPEDKAEPLSSPFVSRPASPRKSIDRPPTPIPLEGPMSPVLSARSGRSGHSFQRIPLAPMSDAVPSPVQELVEDGQSPVVAPVAAAPPTHPVTPYKGQEPFVSNKPASALQALSSNTLGKQLEVRSTTPQIMVEGWLDDVGSPARRASLDIIEHAFPHGAASVENTPNESTVTNASLTPPAVTPLPAEDVRRPTMATDTQNITSEPVKNKAKMKQGDQPATALYTLGTTITDAIKSFMPVSVPFTTNFPEHNVPMSHNPATAPSSEPDRKFSVETVIPTAAVPPPTDTAEKTPGRVNADDTAAEPARHKAAVDEAEQPTPSTPIPGTLPAETSDASHNLPTSSPSSSSKIPRLNAVATPTIPPRPPARIPTGFPFTKAPSVAPATPTLPGLYPPTPAPTQPETVPSSPAPPGFYPATPGPVNSGDTVAPLSPDHDSTPRSDGPPFTPGAERGAAAAPAGTGDKGPFVSFRAKQLLGHFLVRDAPRTGTNRVTARSGAGGKRGGYSLGDDERAWRSGTVPRVKAGTQEEDGLGSGRGERGGRRGVSGD